MLGLVGEASAGHTKNCGVIENVKQSRDYRVKAYSTVSCGFARKWSRRYIRRGARPSGYSCSRPGGNINFICRKDSKYYYAQRV
jgi:hypothetical protein